MAKKKKDKPESRIPVVDGGRLRRRIRETAEALGGAALCYGEPVRAGDRVVIPVARVRAAGGLGFGRGAGEQDGSDGGGGGGAVEATPAGFIDITPDGARYEAIPDPANTARAVRSGASALTVLAGAAIALRRLSRGRKPAGLLRRSS